MQRTTGIIMKRQLHFSKTVMLVLVFMLSGAGNAVAQEGCPAFMVGGFETPQDQYQMGEDIGIVLTLGTEYIQAVPDDTSDQYVDIRKFLYHLDCQPGDTINSCTSAGNTVLFDPEGVSVWTDCLNTKGVDADFPDPTLKWSDDGLTVTWTVDDGQDDALRIPSPETGFETCEVGFDVRVTDLAPGNQDREILEILGWFGVSEGDPDPIPNVECSNGVANPIATGNLTIAIENQNASFLVMKNFTDDNPAPVDVHFACNGGFLSQTEFSITDPATGGFFPWVRFIVYGMDGDEVNCRIHEDPVPTGYAESHTAGAYPGAEYTSMSPPGTREACIYEGVKGGDYTCDVTNTLLPTKVTVNKVWEDDLSDSSVPLIADAEWRCYNVGNTPAGGNVPRSGTYTFRGETDSFDITGVYPSFNGDSFCQVYELLADSYVESDTRECDKVEVPLGAIPGPSCTIYNTVFFEGIPTLSQWGMAVMALLMLGIGLLGFRRFG